MNNVIEHFGIITHLNADKIHVRINQQSACSACHAKNRCMASSSQEKEIIVDNSSSEKFQVGDAVMLYGKSSTGLIAVLFAFVIPFLLILIFLFLLKDFPFNEVFTALSALGILVPYYVILSLFNKKLSKKLKFNLKKLE
ncbi:MAG: SoxR reducing system RseC family protein [Bacteroidales bacterium]|nr:SoxR reducing system RseC family protein [Bacteroidales bacterium]